MTATAAEKASVRGYWLTVVAGWVILGGIAWGYARLKGIPGAIGAPLAAAFLIEFPFYILPGFRGALARVADVRRDALAALMTVSALLPYLAYSVPTGEFSAQRLLLLAVIAAVVSSWYLRGRAGIHDALFLVMVAAIVLARVFHAIYLDPIPGLHVEYLGHVMLIRLAAVEVLVVRGGTDAEFRFWPRRMEWMAGAKWFAAALICAGAAYWALGLMNLRPKPLSVPLAIGTFFGMLWVLAISEEFFFRGLLQKWLGDWMRSGIAGLLIASVLFGAAHLAFGHVFPNWRFAIVAGIAGLCYGMAWRETRTVQASMVAHALLVTVWRVWMR